MWKDYYVIRGAETVRNVFVDDMNIFKQGF